MPNLPDSVRSSQRLRVVQHARDVRGDISQLRERAVHPAGLQQPRHRRYWKSNRRLRMLLSEPVAGERVPKLPRGLRCNIQLWCVPFWLHRVSRMLPGVHHRSQLQQPRGRCLRNVCDKLHVPVPQPMERLHVQQLPRLRVDDDPGAMWRLRTWL